MQMYQAVQAHAALLLGTIKLAYRIRVCHNAVAVGVRTTIPPAGITQTESKPDELNTRRTHTRRLYKIE
jgi:hypothetical protein